MLVRISILYVLLLCSSVLAEEISRLPECEGSTENLIQTGEYLWTQRGLENTNTITARQRIEQAINCFQKAKSLAPHELEISFKLIESLYFFGHFISSEQNEKEKIFEEALALSKETLEELKQITSKPELFSLSLDKQAEILKPISGSADAIFWASITWGLWGMTFGDLKAALNDVAGKCANYSELLILLDPNFADGAGYRLLGRLHTLVPRIPLFTMWIDREKGIKLLEQAVAISTNDPRNELFLAEALLKYDPEKRSHALGLLNRISSLQISGESRIEEEETKLQAKILQTELGK